MAAERITVAHVTPAHLRLITDGAAMTGRSLEHLRTVFTAGDVLTAPALDHARRVLPSARVVNYYGATETPQAMGCWIAPNAADTREKPALGRGIDGVQLLVASRPGALAAVGEPGEILIRTPYLSKGYLNDPALTARRFIRNPFTNDPADLVYRTGDIGRYRPDGAVEFVGRGDFQVKVRGVRVELQEIEQCLLQHRAIADAAVVATGDGADERHLVAFVVAAPGETIPDTTALRAYLASALVDAAIPQRFEALARMPMTTNSKLDRAALASAAAAPIRRRTVDRPRTETEQTVTAIWAEVLRADGLGVHDTFFDRGGHSLLAMQVISRVRKTFGVDVPLRTLFEGPTIAAMAAAIDALVPAHAVPTGDREEFEL